MRKLLLLTIVSLVPAFGCETARRVEVWKAQTFFTPEQPVVVTPGPVAHAIAPTVGAPGCNCQQGAAVPAVTTAPAAVMSGYPVESGETVSTEELDGVLKQP